MREDVMYRGCPPTAMSELPPLLRWVARVTAVFVPITLLVYWGVHGPKSVPQPACSGSVIIRAATEPLGCIPEPHQRIVITGVKRTG